MRTTNLVLLQTACVFAVACSSGKANVERGSTSGTTDCVEVVGGPDCENTGTATGGTGTGTGTGTATGSGTTGGIDTWVGGPNLGSGPGATLYRVEADVSADRDEDGDDPGVYWYVTDMQVDIWDDQGQRASGLDVHLDTQTQGDTVLFEDLPGNPGRYVADVDSYARTYTLKVNPGDPLTWFEAEAVGPAPHVFGNWAPEPWDIAGNDVDVLWAPSGAMFATIDTRGTGAVDIDDDGAYTLPVDQLDHEAGEVGEERVRLRRTDRLDLDNALPTSWFDIAVRISRDSVDTTDSRSGQLQGDIILDNNYDGETGDVFVLAWPDALEPGVDSYTAWTVIPDGDFTDFGAYLLNNLEPGDYYVLAYLDADGSDAGLAAPAGPTNNDPYDDADVRIDPNGTTFQDFDLGNQWNGW